MMMTSRERLRRAYFHEAMDRPAVYCRTGFPENDPSYARLLAYIAEHADVKQGWYAPALYSPYPVTEFFEPYSEDFQRLVHVLHTPKGDLRASWLESLTGQSGLHETHFINDREDAEKYLSLPLPEIGTDVSGFFEMERRLGERGIVEVGLTMNPAGTVAELCGSENFAMMSITDRDILHALCEREQRIHFALLDAVIAQGVGPFFSLYGQEYLVPPLHGARDFDDFNVRYDKPIIDLIHDAGGRMHIHSHGRIKAVMPGFLALGADVLHPFEAPPMGDITPAEVKAMARGKICLEGNIQINRMYEATPDAIREETAALIATAFDDHTGLIISPTASPYIRGEGESCFPQYAAMVETVLNYCGEISEAH
jgi:hypothetical protein